MTESGMKLGEMAPEDFRAFARRFATSDEIGPIQTSLDNGVAQDTSDYQRRLVGLWGCGRLCAAACFHIYPSSKDPDREVVKLDSVIVDHALRRRGLGAVLVAQSFADLVTGSVRRVARIYAHSVHPATVRMLRRLGFNDPQATGAPISDIGLDGSVRETFLKTCEVQVRAHVDQMRLQCAYCRKSDKRARPWCLPRGELPKRL